MDPSYVETCYMTGHRNLGGFPLAPKLTRLERRAVRNVVTSALFALAKKSQVCVAGVADGFLFVSL